MPQSESPPASVLTRWVGKHPSQWIETMLRLLRVHWQYADHRRVVQAMGGASTRELLRLQPRIVYRYSTDYLFLGNPWDARRDMLVHHYEHLNRWHDPLFCGQVFRQGCELWAHEIEGQAFSIHLLGPCMVSRHREGELTLAFRMNGHVLFRLAFSVCPSALFGLPQSQPRGSDESLLYIGQVQGVSDRYEDIRAATRACHDVAPADLLMSALAGVAECWGIHLALGVPQSRQLTRAKPRFSPGFDYDAFWQRHAQPQPGLSHAWIALPQKDKPIELVAAKHRGRTLRKRAFKHGITREVSCCLRAHMNADMAGRSSALSGTACSMRTPSQSLA